MKHIDLTPDYARGRITIYYGEMYFLSREDAKNYHGIRNEEVIRYYNLLRSSYEEHS